MRHALPQLVADALHRSRAPMWVKIIVAALGLGVLYVFAR